MLAVFSVKDNKAGSFQRPFYEQTKVQAIRAFTNEINRAAADNLLHQFPQDFDLYELGTYDESAGTFDGQPALILTGVKAAKE